MEWKKLKHHPAPLDREVVIIQFEEKYFEAQVMHGKRITGLAWDDETYWIELPEKGKG